MAEYKWDVFISHASEDKETVAVPLAAGLERAGVRVWLDSAQLTIGDSLRQKINEGLAESRYGIVVLSPSFFQKRWPEQELDALTSKSETGQKVILPVWHEITVEDIQKHSPLLAGNLAASTANGTDRIVSDILEAIVPERSKDPVDSYKLLFSYDPTEAFGAASDLASDPNVDLDSIVDRLRGLNPVNVLASRRVLAEHPEVSAPILISKILHAATDWHAANQVPDCFDRAHSPYASHDLIRLASDSSEPDVARKAIESLGFTGASDYGFPLLELLRNHGSGYWYDKIEFYVVGALARMFTLIEDDHGLSSFYDDRVRYASRYLKEAIDLAASRKFVSTIYSELNRILCTAPAHRADTLVTDWLPSDKYYIRDLGVRALGSMRMRRLIPHLTGILAADGEEISVRKTAARALGNTGGPEAVDALFELARTTTLEDLKASCIQGLSWCLHECESVTSLDELAEFLLESDLEETMWIYRAYGILGPGTNNYEEPLRTALTSADATVRSTAALALSRVSGQAAGGLIRTARLEAATPLEEVMTSIALLRLGSEFGDENDMADLRQSLSRESMHYHRLLQEDILLELRNCELESASLIANDWRQVYSSSNFY